MSTTTQEHEAHVYSIEEGETDWKATCTCGWQSATTCRKHAGWLMREHFGEAHPEQCRSSTSPACQRPVGSAHHI